MSQVFHALRSELLVELDEAIPDETGLYTAYQLPERERVAIVDSSPDALLEEIRQLGYTYNILSAAKFHPNSDKTSVGSYRRVPTEHPTLPERDAMPRIVEEWEPSECQYHIHVFEHDKGASLFSHYELRPDFHLPSFSSTRLEKHYEPERQEEVLQGAVDPLLDSFLNGVRTVSDAEF